MKRGLFQALTKAYKKCAVLFLAFVLFFSLANKAFAQALQIPDEQNGKTIAIRASVPLAPEFIYSIQKNSSLKLTKAAFALGEEVRAQVKIISGNNFPLRGHKINLQVVNEKKEVSLVLSEETDNDGVARFSFSADERLFGENILRAVDVTYDSPIIISKERAIIIYKSSDNQKEKELAARKNSYSQSLTFGKTRLDKIMETGVYAGILSSSVIMKTYHSRRVQTWSNDP